MKKEKKPRTPQKKKHPCQFRYMIHTQKMANFSSQTQAITKT